MAWVRPWARQLIYGSDSKGVNVNVAVTPIENLRCSWSANYLDGQYTHYDACLPFVEYRHGQRCAPHRRPAAATPAEVPFRVPAELHASPLPWGDMTPYVTYSHVGDHTQDQSGLQELGTYQTLDFGVSANVGENWEFACGNEHDQRAGADREQLAHLRLGGRRGRRDAGASARGSRDQRPGEIQLVSAVGGVSSSPGRRPLAAAAHARGDTWHAASCAAMLAITQ